MTCTICRQRYALWPPVLDKAGEAREMCLACAAEHAGPRRFPEGTQRQTPVKVDTRALDMATAQRDRLAHCLAAVLHQFRRELAGGYSTTEQQQALAEARAALVECGR